MKRSYRLGLVVTAPLWAYGTVACSASDAPSEEPGATQGPLVASDSSGTASAEAPELRYAAGCGDRNPLGNVYWGDLHVHTSYSIDSYTAANRNDPKDAYAYARGATVPVASGSLGGAVTHTIDRPLDFMAATDHSEFLMVSQICVDQHDPSLFCRTYRDQSSIGQAFLLTSMLSQLSATDPALPVLCSGPGGAQACAMATKTIWQKVRAAAEAANAPCKFTAFVGYEWTAATNQANLHRNVIFRSAKVPDRPVDYLNYATPVALWQGLDSACKASEGCDALTIPHNSNASEGVMWETVDDPRAVPLMERYQRLVEIFQHKGASECLPSAEGSDPKCDFENLDPEAPSAGFVRPALARGLSQRAKTGRNALAMGVIGSTDTHNALGGGVQEKGWNGHIGNADVQPIGRLTVGKTFNPGGLAAVWAPENTRDAIFDAMKRRETYATSGPRMPVRFYLASTVANDIAAAALCADPEFPKKLLAAGAAPMGSEVLSPSSGRPYLFVFGMKDEVDLAEIDVVKISAAPNGSTATSLRRFPLFGASRNKACVFYSDATYDRSRPTLYYARVFQKPTPRWSKYDCEATKGLAPGCGPLGDLNVDIQERAWTSPIFVAP